MKFLIGLAMATFLCVAPAGAACNGTTCSLSLNVPNPKVWHTACKTTVAKGKYVISYSGTLYADRINAQMDDPGRIYLSSTLSKGANKETWSALTVHKTTPDKVFQFQSEVTASKTVKLDKATTLYLLVNAHDNDYDNDIEHMRFDGSLTVERVG